MATEEQAKNTLDMTMISVFYDASINPLRKTATKKAIGCWMKQACLPKEMVFVELGFDGKFTFSERDFPSCIHYIRIQGTDKNKYLFQKEHLWNIAAKQAKYEKLMFVDSDIAPSTNINWFKQVHDVLDKCLFTQGFSSITYINKYGGRDFSRRSYSASFNNNRHSSGAPGGVYCINKSTLEAIGWFNFIPVGGGDDLFWSEICGRASGILLLVSKRMGVFKKIQELMKTTGKKNVVRLNANVCHFYHGERKMRSYGQRQYMLMSQYPWMDRIMKDDEKGLLSWVDTSHYFYNAASKLHTVNNQQSIANNLMKNHMNYNKFCRTLESRINTNTRFGSQQEALDYLRDLVKNCQSGSDPDDFEHKKFQFG